MTLTAYEIATYAKELGISLPEQMLGVLGQCGSAAELSLVAAFASRAGTRIVDARTLRCGDTDVRLQHRSGGLRIDLVVERNGFALAVEVDGYEFHHATDEQVARDYLRERRLVAAGFTVVRFTARETLGDRVECWRQIDAILAARTLALASGRRVR